MTDLTIVHSNDLVEAAYSLSLDEMRLICLASTKVDSRKANIGEIKISVVDFIKAYGLEKDHRTYSKLRDAVKSIMRKPVKIDIGNDEIREIAWLDSNVYKKSDDGSYVLVQFSRSVEPYLFELKARYTEINFEHAAKLNTPFSFRLYQWLYKAKNLNKHKEGGAIAVQLEVSWMKAQVGLENTYDRWDDFQRRVLAPAITKINANTDISIIEPMPIRTGRKITSVRFIYALEKETQAKPLRPRLHRRPKVKAGSHAEGEWMRKNEVLLTDYEKALKQYDPSLKLDLADVRRLIDIYKARGECSEIHEHYQARMKELNKRLAQSRSLSGASQASQPNHD